MSGRHRSIPQQPEPPVVEPESRWRARVAFVGAGACAGLVGQAMGLGMLQWPSGGLPGFPWWEPPSAYASPRLEGGQPSTTTDGPLVDGAALVASEQQWLLQAGWLAPGPAAFIGPRIAATQPVPAGSQPAMAFLSGSGFAGGTPLGPTAPAGGSSILNGPSTVTPVGASTTPAVIGEVAPATEDGLGTVGGVVTGTTGTVDDLVTGTTGTVSGVVTGTVDNLVPGAVGGVVTDATGTVNQVVTDTVDPVVTEATGTLGGAVTATTRAVADAARGADAVSATAGDVTTTATGVVDAKRVPAAVVDTADSVDSTVADVIEHTGRTQQQAHHDEPEPAETPSDSARPELVADAVEDVVHAATEDAPVDKGSASDAPSSDSGARTALDTVTSSVHLPR